MAFLRFRDRGDHRNVMLVQTHRGLGADRHKVKQTQVSLGSFRFYDKGWEKYAMKEVMGKPLDPAYKARSRRRMEKIHKIWEKALECLDDNLLGDLVRSGKVPLTGASCPLTCFREGPEIWCYVERYKNPSFEVENRENVDQSHIHEMLNKCQYKVIRL